MQAYILYILAAVAGTVVLYRVGSRARNSAATAPDTTGTTGITEVGPSEAAKLIDEQGAVVVDVRTLAEYEAGRIPKATHVPLRQLPQRIGALNKYKGKPIVVSCRTGRRSAGACAYLAENGFEEVYNLKGGIRAWAHARQSIES